MYTSKMYIKSPVFIQNIFISFLNLTKKILRSTSSVDVFTKKLIENERSEVKLNKYCEEKLITVLNNARDNSPYYSYSKSAKVNIHNFKYITKDEVFDCSDKILNNNIKGRKIKGQTSGTTGKALTIYQNLESIRAERAFNNRQRLWAGYEKGDKRAWIRGDVIVPLNQKKAPFWRYSYFENMILLSSFHMTKDVLQLYIDAMYDFGVNIIQAYPSSIITLAKHLENTNQYYKGNLKSIITSSESLTSIDKKLIEERFNCTVFDWYGLFERVAAIASCEHGRYHILSDYSHVELLPVGKIEDGRDIAEIIGTNFNNLLFPLIKYKTGDHVILSNESKCPCGRVFPIVESIEGRVGDYLVGEDKQEIHILNHIPKGVLGILACQFIQRKDLSVEINVIADQSLFSEIEKNKLIFNTKKRIGHSLKVIVVEVESIKRTKNGKFKQAIREF